MSINNPNSMREMIYSNLELKDTEDLIDIWKQNDHEAWSEEAFEIIRELLLKRLGHIPEQNPQAQVEIQENLYHDPEMLLRLANWSKIFSWVILTISAFFLCGNLIEFVSPRNPLPVLPYLTLPYLPYLTIAVLMPFAGIFSFLVLQAIAGLIYLFMDIEDNTRRA